MNIVSSDLPEVKIIQPEIHPDDRGRFLELYHQRDYEQALGVTFVQDNLSYSKQHVVRGLHFQRQSPQAKLVSVIAGTVFDVAVDVRHDSATFGRWFGMVLDDQAHQQLFIPAGFAHGFCVMSVFACFHYKCSDYYQADDEFGVHWQDPSINIQWPLAGPAILSAKDAQLPTLATIANTDLPKMEARL